MPFVVFIPCLWLLLGHVSASPSPPACLRRSVLVRREWGNMRQAERKAYTDAVLCLQHAPSQLSHSLYNTTSRCEDFTATHMNYTRFVHFDGIFLAWHRGFIRLFEHALRGECQYQGALPYWDWVKHHENLTASPLFDGSPYSLSGQGRPLSPKEKEKEQPCWQVGNVVCPKGPGGGCVTDGPFKNYNIGYQRIDPNVANDPNPGLPSDAFAYVPRCFSRDLSQYIATRYQTQQNLDNLLGTSTIADFQNVLDNVDAAAGLPGLHGAGHYATGPVGGDFFSSPTEPAFYLHHGMIDRVWALWQGSDLARVYGDNALYGTVTTGNVPPSENATMETVLTWGPLGRPKMVREVMKVGRGAMCYEYD
ncbi:Di-copper centre-containing protein [Auricularia subglabra TFB-10046 SS5]|nr:Di-copper centre-containing protein [Auricularia subglabra TFB-10046 SS5]